MNANEKSENRYSKFWEQQTAETGTSSLHPLAAGTTSWQTYKLFVYLYLRLFFNVCNATMHMATAFTAEDVAEDLAGAPERGLPRGHEELKDYG